LGTLDAQDVREIIVAGIRVSISLGATRQAADLLIVLREFFSQFPEASLPAASARNARNSQWRSVDPKIDQRDVRSQPRQ